MVIYESAPAVNPEFESLAVPAAPLVTGLDTLLRSRPEDRHLSWSVKLLMRLIC